MWTVPVLVWVAVQALELNQSVFGRQMEEFQTQQRLATRTLQANQDAFAEQLKEIRSLLTDLVRLTGCWV